MAVYFDQEEIVTQLANYGLQDGRVFDFIARKTVTTGTELTVLRQILGASTVSTGLPTSD